MLEAFRAGISISMCECVISSLFLPWVLLWLQRRTYCLTSPHSPDLDLSVSKQIESLQTEMELR